MQRADSLFAIASIALVGFGLVAPYVTPAWGFTVLVSQRSYCVSPQTPCYAIAGLFALFAFLYSIGYIPFSQPMMQWHFWLSIGGVILFAAGIAGLGATQISGSELGVSGTLIVVALLGSIPIFFFAQVWFAVGLTRSLLRMHLP